MVDCILGGDAPPVQPRRPEPPGYRTPRPWVRWATLGDGRDYPQCVETFSERDRLARGRHDVTGPYPTFAAALAVVQSGEPRDEPEREPQHGRPAAHAEAI